MPPLGPVPLFRGKAVIVDFAPATPRAPAIIVAVNALVRHAQDDHLTEGALVRLILERVAEFDGLTATLVSRTAEAIEFRVTRR